MKEIFEVAVAQPRFSMNQVHEAVRANASAPYQAQYSDIEGSLGIAVSKKIIQAILRFAFFIEPVKTPKIESTKFAVRWGSELTSTDPRVAAYTDCLVIYEFLLTEIQTALLDEEKKRLLQVYCDQSLLAYELPLDYKMRRHSGPIHRQDNIYFFWDDLLRKVVHLRQLLRQSNQANVFKAAYNKVVVKSYLTDRVLTGDHKTNREKRWEAHPDSVHFALRRDCLEIELVLMSQICYFAGFPHDLQQQLEL